MPIPTIHEKQEARMQRFAATYRDLCSAQASATKAHTHAREHRAVFLNERFPEVRSLVVTLARTLNHQGIHRSFRYRDELLELLRLGQWSEAYLSLERAGEGADRETAEIFAKELTLRGGLLRQEGELRAEMGRLAEQARALGERQQALLKLITNCRDYLAEQGVVVEIDLVPFGHGPAEATTTIRG